jgi:type VI protein secretion system component Hcp
MVHVLAFLLMFAPPVSTITKRPPATKVPPAATCTSTTLTNSIFLKIDGIPGDSRDKCHPNEIEPLSFQNSGTSITVVKKIDASSPKLFIEGLVGTNINEAILTVFEASTPPRLIRYKMKHVIVGSINQMAGSVNRETVTLRFQALETEIQSTTGSAQSAAAPAGIDVRFTVAGVPSVSTASMISDGFTARQLGDFVVNKPIDAASPKLMLSSQSGQHLSEVVITLRPRGTSETFIYRLTDVAVTGDMQQGNGSSATEQVRLKPSRIMLEYLSPTGTHAPAKAGYDLKKNERV